MKFVFTLLLFNLLMVSSPSQSLNWSLKKNVVDTSQQYTPLSADSMNYYQQHSGMQSPLLKGNKIMVNDIEQRHAAKPAAMAFIALTLMIAMLAYLKVFFGRELEELFEAMYNRNLAQQIFRSQRGELSFSSMLLHGNFIAAISLYVRFIFSDYLHLWMFERGYEMLLLIFLFTFFYVIKIFSVKFIGVIFEISDECDEYIFNFTNMCKIAGLTLIPSLFLFYAVPVKYFQFFFVLTILIFIFLAAWLIWRGLSTAYKLLYTSVYHFFVYVCVVEISPIFLLFKLLTKTIT